MKSGHLIESTSNHPRLQIQHFEEISTLTLQLAEESPSSLSKNAEFLSFHYQQGLNINRVLCQSSLFARARNPLWPSAPTEKLRQLSAQLHVLAGANIDSPWPVRLTSSCPYSRHGGVFEEEDSNSDWTDTNTNNTPDGDNAEAPPTQDEEDLRLKRRNHPTPLHDVHPWARSRIYDLRRYKESNMWGPFTDSGSGHIDWEKVQSIMVILAYNHRLYTERQAQMGNHHPHLPTNSVWPPGPSSATPGHAWLRGVRHRSTGGNHDGSASRDSMLQSWETPFEGIAANSYISSPLEGRLKPSPNPELDELDPYGVTGTWMRIVCFLDYNDLYRFNFESPANVPVEQERGPISTREAFRLIRLQLHVTQVEEQEGVDVDGNPLLPIVHFEGTSKSTYMAWDPNANSRIRGLCHLPSLFPPLLRF